MCSLTGCAHSDPWTTRNTVLQLTASAVILADAITTSQIQHTPGVYETGPIAKHVLGDQPETSDTILYFSTWTITNYLIARALPRKWRPYWQGSTIVYHGLLVYNNCELDLC